MKEVKIPKRTTTLIPFVLEVVIFAILAILFVVHSDITGGTNSMGFWLFIAACLPGIYMCADWFVSYLSVSDEGITISGLSGKKMTMKFSEISAVGVKKSFAFLYGKDRKLVTSMEADLAASEEAMKILKAHKIRVIDLEALKKQKKSAIR